MHLASEGYNIFCFSESVINGPVSRVCGSTFNNKREVKCAVAHLAPEDYNTFRFFESVIIGSDSWVCGSTFSEKKVITLLVKCYNRNEIFLNVWFGNISRTLILRSVGSTQLEKLYR